MNIYKKNRKNLRHGFTMIVGTVVIGAFLLGVMAIQYRSAIRTLESQKQVQMLIDYEAREQAFLRSLVTLTPQYAASSMADNSRNNEFAQLQTMYQEAAIWANMFEARTSAEQDLIEAKVGDVTLRNGNTADFGNPEAAKAIDYIGGVGGLNIADTSSDVMQTPSSVGATVPAGSTYPSALATRTGAIGTAAKDSKEYVLLSSDLSYRNSDNEVGAAGDLRDYGLIKYPNIHFGYAEPNSDFIAKQNWWQIFLHPQKKDAANTKIGDASLSSKEYVLSLYEIPAQLAISSSTFTNIGETNGTAWDDEIEIIGKIYAKKAKLDAGSYDGIATTEGVSSISSGVTLGSDGATVTQSDSGRTARESFEASNPTKFYPISKASDYARSLFLPINVGLDFFDRYASTDNTDASTRLSRESWNNYSKGCHQATMRLDIIATAGGNAEDQLQTPTELRFTYTDSLEGVTSLVIKKSADTSVGSGEIEWVEDDYFPFKVDTLSDGRTGLFVDIEKFVAWLKTGRDADGEIVEDDAGDAITPLNSGCDLSVNHSLAINVDYLSEPVSAFKPRFPTNDLDAAVALEGCEDFTDFPIGFSIVTNLRLYITEDYNQVLYTTSTNGRNTLTPATSLFAPEVRYGDGNDAREVDIEGSVGNLDKTGQGVNILDFKGAGDTDTVSGNIKANLKPIATLEELPPISVMNWLVVIQKKQ